jgi:ribonuclease P protein component
MLPKKYRASGNELDFLSKNNNKEVYHTDNLFVAVYKHSSPLFAVRVSKKVARSAVTRNKYRRQIFAKLLPYTHKNDLHVVSVKKNTFTQDEVTELMEKVLGR